MFREERNRRLREGTLKKVTPVNSGAGKIGDKNEGRKEAQRCCGLEMRRRIHKVLTLTPPPPTHRLMHKICTYTGTQKHTWAHRHIAFPPPPAKDIQIHRHPHEHTCTRVYTHMYT